MTAAPLLKVDNLSKRFPVRRQSIFNREQHYVHAVNGVDFEIYPGETLGLVGESGSGKSTTGRMVVNLLEPSTGSITFEGTDLAKVSKQELRKLRHNFQIVFQDPYGSLDQRMTVGQIIDEPLRVAGGWSRSDREARVAELLSRVNLSPNHAKRYPHEFSGGQRQRIGIARSLALSPKLVVCDEPVSALDVSVQAQVVNLFKKLQGDLGLAYLFVAHDLAVVSHISDRVAVMYLGRIVEIADTQRLFAAPQHPYSRALLDSVPRLDRTGRGRRQVLGGELPSPIKPPSGCAFHPRCPLAFDRCKVEAPALRSGDARHQVACHLAAAS
jgi:oligopeptide transport system ATP-binding protein